ncbi:MAG: DUF5666 domain-containing protein [bacterium]|nr:DUF5666 domain-containing protein [bacterium]
MRHLLALLFVMVGIAQVQAQLPPGPVETPEVSYRGAESPTFDLFGQVEAVADGEIVIGGQRIDTREAQHSTQIDPGAFVRVRLRLLNTGVWSAGEISLAPTDGLPGIVMISGTVSRVDSAVQEIEVAGLLLHYRDIILPPNLQPRSPVRIFAVWEDNTWHVLGISVLQNPLILIEPIASNTEPTVTTPVSTPEAMPDEGGQGRGRGRGRGGSGGD